MRVLALDTTTQEGSVALVEDDHVVAERAGDGRRSHAERLPGDLLRLLAAHDLAVSDVDVFAVASGPGSFTGLRIGIATMQGLAFVTGRRIAPVSALEALGHLGSLDVAPGSMVAAWMDAHRREVFSALYRVADRPPFTRDRLIDVEPPTVGDPASTLARWQPLLMGETVFVGDGAIVYASVLSERLSDRHRLMAPPALAGVIGRVAVARARSGDTVDPAGVQPVYVRRPDAEVAREKNNIQGSKPPPQRTRS